MVMRDSDMSYQLVNGCCQNCCLRLHLPMAGSNNKELTKKTCAQDTASSRAVVRTLQ